MSLLNRKTVPVPLSDKLAEAEVTLLQTTEESKAAAKQYAQWADDAAQKAATAAQHADAVRRAGAILADAGVEL